MAEAGKVSSKPPLGLRYYLKRTVIYALCAYLLLLVLLFVFQRRLIYPATRVERLDPAHFGFPPGQVEQIGLRTDDGVNLGAWLVRPPNALGKEEAKPLIPPGALVTLFFHGNGGHRGFGGEFYMLLGSLGRHTLALDYRGYGESEGSPTEDGLHEDARAAWAWLIAQGVAPGQVVIHGNSMGSAVAIRLAEELCQAGTPPAGLVLEAPFTSLPDAAARIYWFVPARWIVLDRFPSIDRIGKVTCPLLIFHGRNDGIVPFEHGERIFEAAPSQSAHGIAKRFAPSDAGHQSRSGNEQAYEDALCAFLDEVSQSPEADGR